MTDRRRNLFILLLVAGLLLASVVAIVTKPTKLGLDLKGGVSLVYEAKPTLQSNVTGDAINRSIDIMRERVDQLGVAEPEIQRIAENQIEVSLPDVKNADQAQRQVGTTAQMFFYDWEKNVLGKDGRPHPEDSNVTGGPAAGQPGAGALPYYEAVTTAAKFPPAAAPNNTTKGLFYGVDDKAKRVLCGPQETAGDTREVCQNDHRNPSRIVEVPRGYVVVQSEGTEGNQNAQALARDSYYILKDDPALSGTDIKNPEQNYDNGAGGTGQPNVTFDFTSSGAKKWQQTTREIAQRGQSMALPGVDPRNAFQHFAIVLDNKLISVPYIDFQQNPDGIDGRTGSEISGGFTIRSAQNLANLLKTGALPIKLDLISQSQVSATLGQEALHQGVVAGLVGFAIVALFLVAFYRVLGLLAVGALVLYGAYLFALVKMIPVVLTLPGIAGLVLTIGVCADANIVIFERVKEEISKGRSVSAAIAQGYKKGLSTIIDANVVTFLVAFILFILATAGVKGFALMLGLGTIVTLFSAVLATQAFLGVVGARALTDPRLVGARTHGKKRRIDFNGATRKMFTLSGIILLVSAIAISTKGITFGIDFESGTRIDTTFQKAVSEGQIRSVLDTQGLGDAEIQRIQGQNSFRISTAELPPPRVASVTRALDDQLQFRGQPNTESIGPTFGSSIARSAIIAVIASLIVVAAYIALRFEWKYAVTTAISLTHDLLITAGLYAVTGREVTSSTVAALLTVLGFSLYDTIIVSDRMRENAPRMPRATFSQISNRSMNEVIVRSISTVTCASLPILALLLFGGETLQDFAFALLVGTISGAYSSIFISSPVLTHWKEREPVYRRRRLAQIERYGEVPPFAPEGADVDVDARSKRRAGRLTAPEDPERRVSQSEFDDMVRDIQHEVAPTATATRRKSRKEQPEGEPEPQPEREPEPERPVDPTADATPEELVLKDTPKTPKPKRPRNKRHGRPR